MFSVSLSHLPIVLLLATSIQSQRAGQDGYDQDDPRGVQIIKQINRVNEDGTYTYGYEAADGSFKIETRDVLGNVKGMFGYVDNNGELKRVSYSAANGTGFQATDDYGPVPPSELTTRRPVLVYRGTTPHQIQKIPPKRGRVSTTPVYEYASRRSAAPQIQEFGGGSSEAQQRPPVRVLVTKRPLGSVQADSSEYEQRDYDRNNVIRRQLGARDSQDVFNANGAARAIPIPRDFRYNSQIERPDQREIYRNMLLEQNNLQPDYPSSVPRSRYYPSVADEQQEQGYPQVPAVEPMVNRVLGAVPNSRARPRYVRPPPSVVDENAYPIPPPYGGRRPLYRGSFPPPLPRVPPLYDQYSAGPPIDYEALREEIMNYLVQYIQYRTRGYYNRPYSGGGYADPIGNGILPGDEYYQPRVPAYQQDYYNQRFYSGRIGGGYGGIGPQLPPVGPAPPGVPPPVTPPPLGPPIYSSYPSGAGPGGFGPPPVGPAASYPFINPNVQYSSSEDASGSTTASSASSSLVTQASETLAAFKERMDASDHRDASDTRPPSAGLIRMLLARPVPSRSPLFKTNTRSVEILGTAASENRATSTAAPQAQALVSSTTTPTTEADTDPMIASS